MTNMKLHNAMKTIVEENLRKASELSIEIFEKGKKVKNHKNADYADSEYKDYVILHSKVGDLKGANKRLFKTIPKKSDTIIWKKYPKYTLVFKNKNSLPTGLHISYSAIYLKNGEKVAS